MDEQRFFHLVRHMRAAQKRYFKTKDRNDLRRAKDLERRVDRAIEYKLNPSLAALFEDDGGLV